MSTYLSRICISFSILLNTLIGGKNNQTLSAGQWYRKRNNKANLVALIDLLFWYEKDPCEEAWIKWQIINISINNYANTPRK